MQPLSRSTATSRATTIALGISVVAVVAAITTTVVQAIASGGADRAVVATYRVTVERCPGTERAVATASAVDLDLVATVAHPFTDVRDIAVQASDGSIGQARLVYLDPAKDIALLRLNRSTAEPPPKAEILPLGSAVLGDEVTIVTFALESGPVTQTAAVLDLVNATLDGEGSRAAVKLGAEIGRGDSGAPVVDDDGQLVAMVFATTRNQEVGWAVAASEIDTAIASLNGSRPDVELPAC